MCRGGVLGGSGAVNVGELSSLFIGIAELSVARFRTIGTSSLSESVSLRSESSDERRSAAVSSRRRFAALVSFVGSTGDVGDYELQMIENRNHNSPGALGCNTVNIEPSDGPGAVAPSLAPLVASPTSSLTPRCPSEISFTGRPSYVLSI